MIKLHQFPSPQKVVNFSPFCMKLETYLRMTGLAYEVVVENDPRKGPKGKIPFINDNGKLIGDSNLIIEYLKQTYGDTLDTNLTPQEKATSLAFRRLCDENLYWVILYSRWIDPPGWEVVKKTFFQGLPFPFKLIVPPIVQKKMITRSVGHGMGVHSRDEIYDIGKADVTALSDFLGEKPFFMGENPTSLDATTFSFLMNCQGEPKNSPLSQHTKKYQNILDYCDRMMQRYFGDKL